MRAANTINIRESGCSDNDASFEAPCSTAAVACNHASPCCIPLLPNMDHHIYPLHSCITSIVFCIVILGSTCRTCRAAHCQEKYRHTHPLKIACLEISWHLIASHTNVCFIAHICVTHACSCRLHPSNTHMPFDGNRAAAFNSRALIIIVIATTTVTTIIAAANAATRPIVVKPTWPLPAPSRLSATASLHFPNIGRIGSTELCACNRNYLVGCFFARRAISPSIWRTHV